MFFDRQYSTHQRLSTYLAIAMLAPQLLETFNPVRIILDRIRLTVTLPAVERNQRRQRKRQTCGQLTAGMLPGQQLRQYAGTEFSHAVQGNRQQLMLDVRVAETPRHRTGKGRQLITR